ncbi:MAG TPA: hypothetical protein GXZ50_00770 [Clostridia bacterium]|nr:hypothetical protein [Clostridia bacterium]
MEKSNQIVVFKLEDTSYGFPIDHINQIIKYVEPVKLPNTSEYTEGIINLRGSVHGLIMKLI